MKIIKLVMCLWITMIMGCSATEEKQIQSVQAKPQQHISEKEKALQDKMSSLHIDYELKEEQSDYHTSRSIRYQNKESNASLYLYIIQDETQLQNITSEYKMMRNGFSYLCYINEDHIMIIDDNFPFHDEIITYFHLL